MTKANPSEFKDLDVAELRRSALEDFAVEVDPSDNKASVIAALAESNIFWDDYVAQHPEYAPTAEEVAEAALADDLARGNVITTNPTNPATLSVEPVVEEVQPVIVVKETIPVASPEKYLIKMTRENPLYETCGHRFTQDHPYALVTAATAQYILEREEGFRQAYPAELEEFYS